MPRGMCADPAREAARCEAIRLSRVRRKAALGYINSPATRRAISRASRGRPWTEAQRIAIVAAKKGKAPKNFAACLAAAHARVMPRGAANPSWVGDAVGYAGIHTWIRSRLGRPKKCNRCHTTEAKRYEWANRSRRYLRRIWDWERLCVSCHRKDGYQRGEYQARR